MYQSLWFTDNQWTTAAVLLPLPTLCMFFFLTASIFRAIDQPAASVRPRRDPAGHVPPPRSIKHWGPDSLTLDWPASLNLADYPLWNSAISQQGIREETMICQRHQTWSETTKKDVSKVSELGISWIYCSIFGLLTIRPHSSCEIEKNFLTYLNTRQFCFDLV